MANINTTVTPIENNLSGAAPDGTVINNLEGTTIESKQDTDATLDNLAALETAGNALKVIKVNAGGTAFELAADAAGTGTVSIVSVTTANGVSGSVATDTTTPAISLTLGAITPTSVAASGTVSGSNLSGTNTGDQASVSQTITNGVTTTAPSEDAVFDALALKANTADLATVATSGDALDVVFDPTGLTHTAATNVQEAVADIEGAIISPNAVDHLFDATGLVHTTATNVQVAIEELDAAIGSDTNGSDAGIAAGVTIQEVVSGATHKTVFTFTNVALVLADDPTLGAFGGVKIYGFPKGILTRSMLGNLVATLSAAGVSDTWSGNVNFGTIVTSTDAGYNAEQAYFDPQALGPAIAGVQIVRFASLGSVIGGQATPFNYTQDASTTFGASSDLYVNAKVDAADETVAITPTNLILNGTVTCLWSNNGDY